MNLSRENSKQEIICFEHTADRILMLMPSMAREVKNSKINKWPAASTVPQDINCKLQYIDGCFAIIASDKQT